VVIEGEDAVVVFLAGQRYRLEREKPARIEEEDPSGRLVSPLPGNVVQVMVTEGAEVQKGQPLMIIEAMKMEHVIVAPHAGRVSQLYFSAGERVAEGAQLLALENS
jgi:3-methylcrotonyl-CoA carboxylase alpha subunit